MNAVLEPSARRPIRPLPARWVEQPASVVRRLKPCLFAHSACSKPASRGMAPCRLNTFWPARGPKTISYVHAAACIGVFRLGMWRLTDGLRLAAGSALRDVLAHSTRTPAPARAGQRNHVDRIGALKAAHAAQDAASVVTDR